MMIDSEEVARRIGIPYCVFRGNRANIPGFPPYKGRRGRAFLFNEKSIDKWLEANYPARELFLKAQQDTMKARRAQVRAENKVNKPELSMIQRFIRGEFDHPQKRHNDERKLDRARVRMPKTTIVSTNADSWLL